ncbi:MAG: S41 family peptidase [Clostridia bacterium]|nr:S41 family peptidase [Clostridia bacterium]
MEFIKKKNIFRIIMLILLTAFITFLLTTIFMYSKVEPYLVGKTLTTTSNKTSNMTGLTQKLSNIKTCLTQMYRGEINDNDLLEGAIKGYVEGLGDEYTEYFTAEEMKNFLEDTTGKYVGIGIYMQKNSNDDNILVLSTMKGSPAEQVGLKSGDIITKIDGEECANQELSVSSDKIKGEEGTKVNLEIYRGSGEILNFEIERKPIEVNQVASEKLDDDIGYIEIASFNENVATHFEEHYRELEKQGIKSLIIDLRNNGGGIVDEALYIAETMVNKGDTLLIKSDKDDKEDVTVSKKDPIVKVPVVVLINEYSASASEILAGILHDNIGTKLIGTKSYGKGVIQTAFSMSDGSGLKITTNEYFTPNHNTINKTGINPDVEVELPDEFKYSLVVEKAQDTQLQKAIEVLKTDM